MEKADLRIYQQISRSLEKAVFHHCPGNCAVVYHKHDFTVLDPTRNFPYQNDHSDKKMFHSETPYFLLQNPVKPSEYRHPNASSLFSFAPKKHGNIVGLADGTMIFEPRTILYHQDPKHASFQHGQFQDCCV